MRERDEWRGTIDRSGRAVRRAARHRIRHAALGAAVALAASAGPAPGQSAIPTTDAVTAAPAGLAGPAPAHLPFFAGEQLAYAVHMARVGRVGRVTMQVDGPERLRGTDVVVLRFALAARMGLLRAEDRTASWLDPVRLRALRYEKHERRPLARLDEAVEIDAEQRRWTRADGTAGASDSDAPLDELSFLYLLRTLPLAGDTAWTLDRHYDPARNPTRVRIAGRRTVATPAGTFQTVTIEMRVRDARRYQGEGGVIRVDVTDDACRLPVRIESDVPVFGRAVLLLAAHNHAAAHHLALTP